MQVYVFRTEGEEPEELTGVESDSLCSLIITTGDEMLWADDGCDSPLDPTTTLGELGPGRSVFCGPCLQVAVDVRYNGQTASRSFSPGTLIRRVLAWAIHDPIFEISDPQMGDYSFKVSGREAFPELEDPIGRFALTDCQTSLDLRPTDKFQG